MIDIMKLNETQLVVTDINTIKQYWHSNTYSWIDSPRNFDGFCLYLKGGAEYSVIDSKGYVCETVTVKSGDLVYLPKGANYSVTFLPQTDYTENILINFLLFDKGFSSTVIADSVIKVINDTPANIKKLFYNCLEEIGNANQIKSIFYKILNSIGMIASANRQNLHSFEIISPAIHYMENHLAEDFSVTELSRICNVSETYFRRKFKECTGKSPLKYKNDILMEKARSLLLTNTMTVKEVADSLGFYDTAYFCKVFKAENGKKPSEYIELTQKNGDRF